MSMARSICTQMAHSICTQLVDGELCFMCYVFCFILLFVIKDASRFQKKKKELTELMENNLCLYDSSDNDYKNIKLKDDIMWREIAIQIYFESSKTEPAV